MSNLERWHDDQNPSDGENDVEDELLPHFLRPTAQSERRNEAARLDMAMAMTRDAGLENGGRGASIVDQSQFRNTQIGVGYQHKTVVRQPTVETSAAPSASVPGLVDKTPEAVMARKEAKKRRRE